MYYTGVTDGKRRRRQNISQFCFLSHNILGHSQCVKKFVTEKEKWTNKGNDKQHMLILFYTIQQVIPNVCTKFQNPRHKFPYVLHWSERWKKGIKPVAGQGSSPETRFSFLKHFRIFYPFIPNTIQINQRLCNN